MDRLRWVSHLPIPFRRVQANPLNVPIGAYYYWQKCERYHGHRRFAHLMKLETPELPFSHGPRRI